ncbi:hypothetical protein A2954_05495 [Candidatus Roizmanbacteria bacterium RIFCSPLOWO2_01_FULL_37_12]|uniref:Nudix hydrolase domain-containing protein n=1 Tax=Candidatus Roizmanbacteria bacterium RIFCSPLOWO2_01_FULL_37_12 TaxID=1802056 RepID=A0A1F7I931_9BACT|nr:MAG: hypothetical protein A3D76_04715 [Candidatus Roizmanbacteria bacterium RIFCSPHIGHO2_02_FULL_37_9b]OGK39875.1 MAG: hypothetical protein A2954_05495 [Candidatus Roizmanbacteria bacterium RIFCSPLOWO2_01_FULL_37_12]
MKDITPFVVGLIKSRNKYLLTKRNEIDRDDPKDFLGKWQLPGGGINFAESLETAVKREIKEEVGLDIKVVSFVPYIINSVRKYWHGIGVVILCKLDSSKQKVVLNEEANDYGWFTYEEVMNLDVLPGVINAINASRINYFNILIQ